MTTTTPRLGRGLDALLGGVAGGASTTSSEVEIPRIQRNPYQPRKEFDEDQLQQLTDSIKTHGILQPIVVRDVGDHFQLIAGERRLRAATAAGLIKIPVHIVHFDDQQVYEAALVENIQRTDLNAIEKAEGFKDYIDRYQMTHEQLGQKLGIDRASVSNLVGLLNLPKEVQDAVRMGQITLGHAKILKGLSNKELACQLCKMVIVSGMSVQALDTHIKELKAAKTESGTETGSTSKYEKTAHVVSVENELRQRLAVKVEIKVKAQERGQIVIGFETNDDFERIIEALRK